MKSRHTPMTGRIVRSFGLAGTDDLVVELTEDSVVFRKEPVDRRLNRGEKLPERRINVRDGMRDLSGKPPAEVKVEAILEELLARLPIAKLEGDTPKNVAYSLKVWMLRELKRTITKEELAPDEETS